MQHFVLGTAGHVDHGKTSLIKALTGIDTDRLKEEKERGITIELGFASLALPSGRTLGIVDVPGHEKFVKHMVSGAAGIDLVLLVIAADEGVMPQTREHLQICSLLGIRHGLVALTKIDMVEPDWLELVTQEITEYLADSFLAGAPIVPVSAVKQTGLDELIRIIDETAAALQDKPDDGIFRLPIDRVFTMKGFGTVVTGTLISDRIRVGDDIRIEPAGIDARIRGIQVHGQSVEEAAKGQRTAINLQGIEKETLSRGQVLVRPRTIEPSRRMDVAVNYLPTNTRKLKNRSLVRLHTGAMEIMARVVLMEADEVKPGEKTFAQLILTDEDVVVAGDHFVLRSYSPVTTIGGGRVLDPLTAKHKRRHTHVLNELQTLDNGELIDRVSVILERSGYTGVSARMLAFRLGVHIKKIREALEKLFSARQAISLGGDDTTAVAASLYRQLEDRLLAALEGYHQRNPLKEGISKEELKASLPAETPVKVFNMALLGLAKKEAIVAEKDFVRLASHRVRLADEEDTLRRALIVVYEKVGLTPPSLSDVLNTLGDQQATAKNILALLIKEGELIKINEEMVFAKSVMERLREDYRTQLARDGRATPASFKELTGLSRKYIIPLMEYFDASKLTVRAGDHRILREKI